MKCFQSAAALVCACLSLASALPGYAEPDYSEPALYTFTYGKGQWFEEDIAIDKAMNMTRQITMKY